MVYGKEKSFTRRALPFDGSALQCAALLLWHEVAACGHENSFSDESQTAKSRNNKIDQRIHAYMTFGGKYEGVVYIGTHMISPQVFPVAVYIIV